jgi:hypothetical protein
MKIVTVTVAAVLLLTAANARAQTNRYPVKLRAVIDIGTAKAPVTETLLTTNRLVLVINRTDHRASLEEWDMAITNQLNVLVNRRRLALLPGGRFEFITQNFDTDEQEGAFRIAGSESPATGPFRKVRATITGVYNDAQASGTNVDAVIRGKLISDGPPF